MKRTVTKEFEFDADDGERSFKGTVTVEVSAGRDNGGWTMMDRVVEIEGTIDDDNGGTYAIWPNGDFCPDWICKSKAFDRAIEDAMEEVALA